MEVRESSEDAAFSSLRGAAKLVQVGMTRESKVGWLKALIILSRALSMKLEELEIPCC